MLGAQQNGVGYPRSIAVKQAQIPSSTEQTVVIRPLKDGSGFLVVVEDLLAAGLSPSAAEEVARLLRQINAEIARKLAQSRGSEYRRRQSKGRHEAFCVVLILAATVGFALVQADVGQLGFLLGSGILVVSLCIAVGYGLHTALAGLESPPDYTALVRGAVEAGQGAVEAALLPANWQLEIPPECFWLRLGPARVQKTGAADRLNLYN